MQGNSTSSLPNPSGLCECGCGQTTPIAARTRNVIGHVRGEHIRFIRGHGGYSLRGVPRPDKQSAMVSKACAYCGEPFQRKPGRMAKAMFCSTRCGQRGQGGRTAETDRFIDIGGGVTAVPVGPRQYAFVNTMDVPLIESFTWTSYWNGRTQYALTRLQSGKTLLLHRLLLNPPDGVDVDHANEHGLDNRRANMRIATRAQNNINRSRVSTSNTSGYIGVSYRKDIGAWRAYISQDGRQISIGMFATAKDAARARDIRARELFGEFAPVNLPEDHSRAA